VDREVLKDTVELLSDPKIRELLEYLPELAKMKKEAFTLTQLSSVPRISNRSKS
jgi:hypothetical protein